MSTSWSETPASVVHTAMGNFWSRSGPFAKYIAHRLARDPKFSERMLNAALELIQKQETQSQEEAAAIMGRNYFSVAHAKEFFGIQHGWDGMDALEQLIEVPFTKAKLEECKDTHLLFPYLPLNPFELVHGLKDKNVMSDQDWYLGRSMYGFGRFKTTARWVLLRKTPVDGSLDKTWASQDAPESEDVPSAHMVMYALAGHFLKEKERLFEGIVVRCSDSIKPDHRVSVGFDRAGGINVAAIRDEAADPRVGLASHVRHPTLW